MSAPIECCGAGFFPGERCDACGKTVSTECLEANEHCEGPVNMWTTDGLRSWPRCEYHGLRRLERHDNSLEAWADSDVAPSWFDPSYAGERWDDDY